MGRLRRLRGGGGCGAGAGAGAATLFARSSSSSCFSVVSRSVTFFTRSGSVSGAIR